MLRLLLVLVLMLSLVGCRPPPAAADQVDPARVAETARWGPGQLEAHYQKHGAGHRDRAAYDAAARETIGRGVQFTYRDRESRQRRLGFYRPGENAFTGLTIDGERMTTHFRPDDGERYVRRLPESTYR